jgi:putative flippase GtrA
MIVLHWVLGGITCLLVSIGVRFICDAFKLHTELAKILAMIISIGLFMWAMWGKP